MWVKICGTTTPADAQLAVDAGADAVGFVFAPSKRQVTVAEVAAITDALPAGIEKAGVFQEADVTVIAACVREAALSVAQLHFHHDPVFTAALHAELGATTKLLQVVSCPSEGIDDAALSAELSAALEDSHLWGVLLDASTRGVSGGTGRTFDWQKVAATLDRIWSSRSATSSPKLILAGGLSPDNVREAMQCLQPFGVDVVSGVEAAPRVKDPVRVGEFVRLAKT